MRHCLNLTFAGREGMAWKIRGRGASWVGSVWWERSPCPELSLSTGSQTIISCGSKADLVVLYCQRRCNGDRLVLPSLDHLSFQDTSLLLILSMKQGQHHGRDWRDVGALHHSKHTIHPSVTGPTFTLAARLLKYQVRIYRGIKSSFMLLFFPFRDSLPETSLSP